MLKMTEYTGLVKAEVAGKHLIIDLWGVSSNILSDKNYNKNILKQAAKDTCATVLETNFYGFGENFGVTGVVLLSESHISIHTWPEVNLATIDSYMCGTCDPEDCLKTIINGYNPDDYQVNTIPRGVRYIKY